MRTFLFFSLVFLALSFVDTGASCEPTRDADLIYCTCYVHTPHITRDLGFLVFLSCLVLSLVFFFFCPLLFSYLCLLFCFFFFFCAREPRARPASSVSGPLVFHLCACTSVCDFVFRTRRSVFVFHVPLRPLDRFIQLPRAPPVMRLLSCIPTSSRPVFPRPIFCFNRIYSSPMFFVLFWAHATACSTLTTSVTCSCYSTTRRRAGGGQSGGTSSCFCASYLTWPRLCRQEQ